MASTTKIMTALLALERGNLNQVVTVDVNAADMPDSSVMGLSPGERLTLRDLLYGLLLPSGNDAARQIARTIAGSEPAFVDLMNRRAAELGLADTHYANPHGLDAPGHYTSAADLAKLARIALRNPTFAQIVATQQKTVKGRATYDLHSTNPLLGQPGVEGVKTGHTDLAGACLVAAVRRDGHRVITVVLNSPDYSAEALALAYYAFAAYAWPTLSLPASPFDLGSSAGAPRLGLAQPPPVVLPAWEVPYLRADIAPGGKEARFSVAGSPIATVPLTGGHD
jgi:D-alanyl-D-alanine carboxypeptidase (penicillin-binding protein 5/6)